MNVPHIKTSRRSILKGITLGAGAVVLQPVLRALAAEAAGEEAPRRVVFVLEGNGLFPNHIQPQGLQRPKFGSGQLIDRSLADYKLPDPIAPLAPFKDRMTIIQGLSSNVSRSDHSTCYGALGCYSGKYAPRGQTIDSALSDSLPGIFPVLALGLARTSQQVVAYNFSATGPGKPIPIHCRPDRAFETLFSSVADGNAAKKGDLRSHYLDYMASDVRRVRTALAGPERERLDSYLESYESLRKREIQIAGKRDDLKKHKPNSDKFASDSETDRWESHIDLAASSLLAGLTNVVTLSTEIAANYYTTWNGLGIPIDGHKIGHMTGHDGRTAEELSVIIRQYIAKQIARLATRLASVKEGNGTVLDNTLIVYMSDAADRHHSYDCQQWPMVLIGNLGGKLKTNRFLEFPRYGANGHRTTGNCFLSLLDAVGDRREKFGAEDFDLKGIDTTGPLSEILV